MDVDTYGKIAVQLEKHPVRRHILGQGRHVGRLTPPAGVDEARLRDKLMTKYGIEIAGGLGQFAGKILRIGSMGPLATDASVDFLLEAIAASL